MENIQQPTSKDVHETTPSGETGVQDHREAFDAHGKGRVADAAGVKSIDGERHIQPEGDLSDMPTADDPYGTLPDSGKVRQMQRSSSGPTYEAGQGTQDPDTGGSTDPHNFMTHANSGDETEMEENMNDVDNQNRTQQQNEPVDGFTDTEGQTDIGMPDPGKKPKIEPMNPDEYAKAQKEARTEEDHER
jgi:hypothetical protein